MTCRDVSSYHGELERVRRTNESDAARLQASLRKAELRITSLEQSLDQKVSTAHSHAPPRTAVHSHAPPRTAAHSRAMHTATRRAPRTATHHYAQLCTATHHYAQLCTATHHYAQLHTAAQCTQPRAAHSAPCSR